MSKHQPESGTSKSSDVDQICISGKRGTRCLRFREAPGGLQGWDGDKPDLKFSR
ncbi:hypothetical protein [Mesorhizobium abyssinicae]|uniref:hypothetical protein n=1 Tax=Mesorhizobium abyssinicae TaxID=1209958 RepID=UPI00339ACA4B